MFGFTVGAVLPRGPKFVDFFIESAPLPRNVKSWQERSHPLFMATCPAPADVSKSPQFLFSRPNTFHEPMGAETNITPGKKILVVDDDQIILKTLTIALSCKGYQVLTAVDGPGAVSIVSRDRPDLILLDLNFPPDAANVGGALQDGFFIIEWLRRMGEAGDIPIIIISGDKSAKYRKRAQAAKVIGFFPKPIDHIALVDTIRTVLGENVGDKPPGPA
jgi:CheY-like chemotaxis protein